jgi:hypothetical protein
VDLLTRALGKGGEEHGSEGRLLAELVHSYDSALIRLCNSLGVPATAERFGSPVRERARLEGELERLGVVPRELQRA